MRDKNYNLIKNKNFDIIYIEKKKRRKKNMKKMINSEHIEGRVYQHNLVIKTVQNQ